ncbi:MAG: GNAT family N-acetyltransferase [Gammaproteobacteria bacterium]
MKFSALFDPDEASRIALASACPENVFCSVAYSRVIDDAGYRLAILADRDSSGAPAQGCYAVCRFGKLTNTLEIISLPAFRCPEEFSRELEAVCREQRINRLLIGTFGSPQGTMLPTIGRDRITRERLEFALDLTRSDFPARLSNNHKRNRNKAIRAGLQVTEVTERGAVDDHLRLMNASIDRRADRGEAIGNESDGAKYGKFISAGAGSFYQARLGDDVVSSILVLRSEKGAYYHSAGTSPAGMKIGASIFTIVELAERLREEGCRVLNLGGTDPGQEGLRRFKRGFGTEEILLQSARSYFGSRLRQRLVAVYHNMRGHAA